VIFSQEAIGELAGRIERAYRRRHPMWQSVGLTPGVWESAAARLYEAAAVHPTIPVDPELYVAVQDRGEPRHGPWAELAQVGALRRYLKAVGKIVGQLRVELRSEVRRAEIRLNRGVPLDQVLASETTRLSPLSRYILAHRAGRPDLSIRWRAAAEGQHRSCPLYRLASRALLPSRAYPTSEEVLCTRPGVIEIVSFSIN